MLKKLFNLLFKKLILIYLFIFPGSLNFKNLSSFNFREVDFNNYEKVKNLIFKKNFFKIEKNKIIDNFDFINLCAKIGGKRGIEISKINIFNWFLQNKFKTNYFWETEQISNRIINLIYNFDFINSISTRSDENKLKKILKIHIGAYNKFILTKKIENCSISEFKILILTKYIFGEEEKNIENKIKKIFTSQLDSFSMHKSYNFIDQAKYINDLNEIISILLSFEINVPEIVYLTKIKMETVLAQYFHKDGSIALFNGSNNYNLDNILSTLNEKRNIRKIEFPNEKNGIFFYEDSYKKIFFDTVQPTNSELSKKLSAGTLSLEFSADKEKIITNCGAFEKNDGNAAYLRYSAAHSTIILENTNVSEIRADQPYIKYPQLVSFKKQKDGKKQIIESSHNGYIKNYKKIVKRIIYFEENQNYLMGEDFVISSTSENREVVFHIRFHILPNINITETNSKKSIILKTKNNIIWVFKSNKDLFLEESVFMDKNNIKETKQIVIKGLTKQSREKIQWSLSKK